MDDNYVPHQGNLNYEPELDQMIRDSLQDEWYEDQERYDDEL